MVNYKFQVILCKFTYEGHTEKLLQGISKKTYMRVSNIVLCLEYELNVTVLLLE